jgi:hypothetical protein
MTRRPSIAGLPSYPLSQALPALSFGGYARITLGI